MIFSPSIYQALQKKLRTRYRRNLKQLLLLASRSDRDIFNWLSDHSDELEEYSPIHWYFVHELKRFAELLRVRLPERSEEDEFSPEEEFIFNRWTNSEFADVFMKELNRGRSFRKSAEASLEKFEEHLLNFGERYILKSDLVEGFYREQISLGERKVGKKFFKPLVTTLDIDRKHLELRTSSLKEMKLHSLRIEDALQKIRTFSPDSWIRFSFFTDTVVPIKNKEFVSYSHQSLPGFSMINLYDRDDVDLLDDLIHENGHHHLNAYLNLETLIEEPEDQIFYSPWRRSLRPLRGIYHAYFTFFWAFKLFQDFVTSKDFAESDFSASEKEKMIWRMVEEYWMLKYTFEDLKWAKRKKLISDRGWELIQELHRKLQKFERKVPEFEKKISKRRKDLSELKKELQRARRNYALN
jgi:hypothetical protein